MDYREHEVPAPLRRHVQCIWRLRDASHRAAPQTIFPDGRCELIVHFGRPPRAWDPGQGWHEQARELFAGQHRSAIRLASLGELDCLGIRLMPAASASPVGGSLAGLRDRIVDLETLAPHFVGPLREASSRFANDAHDPTLPALLESRLLGYRIDERIETAVRRMEARQGRDRIERTAAAVGMSVRNFQLRFLACVGLGAKEFARVLRLQATIRSLDTGAAALAQLAFDAGFSDQSHATREIARFTGSTPAVLRSALQSDRDSDATIQLAAAFVRGRSAAS